MTTLSDKELWDAVVADDDKAFAALYNRYWKKLFTTVFYYLKDETAAEEVLQDVFVVLWNRRKYLAIDNFNSYIRVTARYHVFKQLKENKKLPVSYIESYTDEPGLMVRNAAEETIDLKDFKVQLDYSLKGLPKRCQEVFWLSRVDQLSNSEIAEHFDISKRTVENQITKALKHLRESYKESESDKLILSFIIFFIML